jgi:two-component system OmpR family response regulator
MRVLVTEDEPEMAALLQMALEEAGYGVDLAATGERAVDAVARTQYDAIVLDVMLPALDGFATCRRIRARGVGTPILMLTARAGVRDRVTGLDAGADDYLPKPFSLEELLARVRALLRRGPARAEGRIAVGDLSLEVCALVARRRAATIELTPREAAILELLMERPGQIVTRDEMLRRAWDGEPEPQSNVIEVLVNRLRQKVDRPFALDQIETVRGVGYRLRKP